MTVTKAHRDQIELDLLKSVMRSFLAVPLLYPTVCALIALTLPSTFSPTVIIVWWLVLVATQVEYAFYQNRFFRNAHEDAEGWTKATAVRCATMNCVWVVMVVLFWSPTDEIQNLGLILIQVIHSLISTILSSPRRLTLFACSLPNVLAALVAALINPSPTLLVLGGAFMLTYLFLIRMGAQSRASSENEFMLRLHNQNLITELSRREEQFRALVDNAFEGIIVTDADLMITYASPAVRSIGLDPVHMMGKSIFAYLQQEEADTIRNAMDQLGWQTPPGEPLEFHTTRIDGKVHWFETSVTDMRDDPVINGYVLNMRDITERKRSQMELINQSRVLEALATGAPIDDVMVLVAKGAEEANPGANVAIYLADNELNLTVCASPSFPEHFKQAISEFWENNKKQAFGAAVIRDEGLLALPDLLSFHSQPDVIEFAKAFNVRGLWMQRFKATDNKGGTGAIAVYHELPREPSRWEKSYLQGVAQLAAIAINRRRAEQNLREATHSAELANRAKTKFLANMSHELRTPLNAIIGFSDIMKSELFGALGSARYAEYAKDINDSGAHLLSVIDDILDISKIEAGRYPLEESNMDIAPTLEWSIEMVRPKTVEKQLTVTLEIDDDLPLVYADTRAIRQIMLNLLSNATKFTPSFGTIEVSARIKEDGALHLCIKDSGIGIPADKIKFVLEPFGQVDDTSARQHGGTGLGLSITKSLVELHDGTFYLESKLEVGTTAHLILPASRLREASISKKAAAD